MFKKVVIASVAALGVVSLVSLSSNDGAVLTRDVLLSVDAGFEVEDLTGELEVPSTPKIKLSNEALVQCAQTFDLGIKNLSKKKQKKELKNLKKNLQKAVEGRVLKAIGLQNCDAVSSLAESNEQCAEDALALRGKALGEARSRYNALRALDPTFKVKKVRAACDEVDDDIELNDPVAKRELDLVDDAITQLRNEIEKRKKSDDEDEDEDEDNGSKVDVFSGEGSPKTVSVPSEQSAPSAKKLEAKACDNALEEAGGSINQQNLDNFCQALPDFCAARAYLKSISINRGRCQSNAVKMRNIEKQCAKEAAKLNKQTDDGENDLEKEYKITGQLAKQCLDLIEAENEPVDARK